MFIQGCSADEGVRQQTQLAEASSNFPTKSSKGPKRNDVRPGGDEMSQVIDPTADSFVDRRDDSTKAPGGVERRQFANSHQNLSPEAAELAQAIDGYKSLHRRRFITYEEMLSVIKTIGYHK